MSIPERLRERMANAPALFHKNDGWTMLAADADSIIYKVAATTKTLETAKRRFVSEALTLHFLADAALTRLHLTPKHCRKAGRFTIIAHKPYQGNRKNSVKPSLVEPLRYAVGREQLVLPPELQIVFNDVYEADDSVVMDCHTYGDAAIYYSEDKDLDCLRNKKLCQKTSQILPAVPSNSLGTLEIVELSASKKVAGRGPLFFWAQMLMGDTADNIQGITRAYGKLCGPVKAYELLEGFIYSTSPTAELELATFVLGLYMDNNQNPWPEAWLLWLYPKDKYTFANYLKDLGLLSCNTALSVWLNGMMRTQWFDKRIKI